MTCILELICDGVNVVMTELAASSQVVHPLQAHCSG